MDTRRNNDDMFTLRSLFYPYQWRFFSNRKRRKIWVSSRQLGKSWTLGALLVYKALAYPKGLSLCISTGARAAAEVIKKCELFAEAVKTMTDGQIDYTSNFEQVKFSNGCRVMSLPSSTDGANLRGYSAQCVCIDEAAFIPRLNTVMQAIGPTLSRFKDSELVFTTTPAGRNGDFYKLYQEALQRDDWYVQHTTIHDAIADGLQVDLEQLRTLVPDPDVFAQEYECKFLSEYASMIDTSLIDWYDDEPKGIDGRYLGMDIGSRQDRSAITTLLTKGDCAYVSDIAMLDKVEYERQLEIVKELNGKHRYTAGFVDETGIGSAFASFVTKNVSSLLKGLTFTTANKTPMYEQLRSMVFQHKLFVNRKLKPLII